MRMGRFGCGGRASTWRVCAGGGPGLSGDRRAGAQRAGRDDRGRVWAVSAGLRGACGGDHGQRAAVPGRDGDGAGGAGEAARVRDGCRGEPQQTGAAAGHGAAGSGARIGDGAGGARARSPAIYRLGADGRLCDALGAEVPAGVCPVGCWVALDGVIPGNADVSLYGRVTPFFAERAVFECRTRRLKVAPAGVDLAGEDDEDRE